MDLGIVIVSYNTRDITRDCLASVFRALETDGLAARVCVVDNASQDGSATMIREAFPDVLLVDSGENLGFAGGTNLGLRTLEAEGLPPRVLLLNPDTLIEPGAFPRMTQCLDADPTIGAVGAQLAYGDGSFQHGAFHLPTLWMILFDFWTINHRLINSRLNGRYPRRLYEAGEPFPIGHPLGAAIMIRRETLLSVGPLDDSYFMYCEEIDWCIRAHRAGWGVYCAPCARIVHLEGRSTTQFRDRMFVALWRSRFQLFGRYYGRAYNRCARLIVRAGLARRAGKVRSALERGEIDESAAERQFAAFRTVLEM